MTDTIARTRVGSKHFEISVNLEEALKIRKGESKNISGAMLANNIFYNTQDGSVASKADMEKAFGTSDSIAVAEKIIKKGEIQLPKKYVDEALEQKKKKVIDWYVRNAVDAKTNRPFTPETISDALDSAGANIDNRAIEQQIAEISEKLSKILPLKIETKNLAITVPAVFTGKIYGLLNDYKEKEEWLSNGNLRCVVSIPVGLQSEFYDKLNAVTHGAALTEEIKEKGREGAE